MGDGARVTRKQLFCFGMGFSAQALIRCLPGRSWTFAGTSRDGEGETIPFNREQPLADPGRALAGTTHILLSIPPDEGGDPVLACHGDDIAKLPGLRWLGYLSTTGVYGDLDGGWAFEWLPANPGSRRGERRADRLQAGRAGRRQGGEGEKGNRVSHGGGELSRPGRIVQRRAFPPPSSSGLTRGPMITNRGPCAWMAGSEPGHDGKGRGRGG